jgi:hypothetical protein
MDLTTAITDFQHAKVMSDVHTRVARKVLEMQKFQGAAAIELIEAAGKTADEVGEGLVAAATGLGGKIDTYG